MQRDVRLRAAAQAIYAVPFGEAERLRTIHYRRAVDAARRARDELAAPAQLAQI